VWIWPPIRQAQGAVGSPGAWMLLVALDLQWCPSSSQRHVLGSRARGETQGFNPHYAFLRLGHDEPICFCDRPPSPRSATLSEAYLCASACTACGHHGDTPHSLRVVVASSQALFVHADRMWRMRLVVVLCLVIMGGIGGSRPFDLHPERLKSYEKQRSGAELKINKPSSSPPAP
jgi:hypothetical protein